mmetsp:Transcript_28702/g.42574  ORF Transcript_28702/g.42574 Transcript_28702/m.42574 type:complete len:116 (+) Transcript_28702:969-1316(+)
MRENHTTPSVLRSSLTQGVLSVAMNCLKSMPGTFFFRLKKSALVILKMIPRSAVPVKGMSESRGAMTLKHPCWGELKLLLIFWMGESSACHAHAPLLLNRQRQCQSMKISYIGLR